MKSVKEISAIISKLSKQVKDLENQAKENLEKAKKLSHGFSGKWSNITNDPDFTTWKALHDESDNAYIKAAEIEKIILVWKFNLLHAKKAELLPIWAGVMKEYQGKKIGEVREKEIRTKLHELGISGYFSNYEYSSPKINIAFLNNGYCCGSDYIELTGNYNIKFFDPDNKFVMPELESFKFYGENIGYIENPKQYIKNLEKLAKKAKSAAAVYDTALHEYNAAAVPGFNQIDTYKTAPASISEYFRIKN